MSMALLPLAILMGLVTYALRAMPLLAPGFDRLPERAKLYLQLVGPSVLSALAAVNTTVLETRAGMPAFRISWEWLAVGLCIAVVGLRKGLLIGLILAAGSIAVLRAVGIAPLR